MEITFAAKDDINGILAVQTQIYRIDRLPDNAKVILSELIDSKDCDVVVAKQDNKIVGSCFLFYIQVPAHGSPYSLLEGMVVHESQRGKGIGTDLTKKAIELARQKGCYKIIFTSGFDREEANKFYENQGFKKWGYEFRMDL